MEEPSDGESHNHKVSDITGQQRQTSICQVGFKPAIPASGPFETVRVLGSPVIEIAVCLSYSSTVHIIPFFFSSLHLSSTPGLSYS